jgi:hypothetical protein
VVAVLYDPVLAPGSRTVTDLIPVPATWSAWQLLVAFALFALLRGRRFGRPVAEPQPVELPGSLLIRATAELQRRAGSHEHASTTLRDELDRRLRRELRAAPELPPAELARLAAASGRVDPVDVERALGSAPASNGPMLASLVADIDRVNRAVLDRRHAGETDPSEPAPPPPGGLS